MVSIVLFSSPHITQSSWINPWPRSSASHIVNYSCLSVYSGKMSHFRTNWIIVYVWQASWTNHSKISRGNFQHQYLPELLVNVYSYHLMVKCVCYYCMCGSQLFSNPVTYVYLTSVTSRLACHHKSQMHAYMHAYAHTRAHTHTHTLTQTNTHNNTRTHTFRCYTCMYIHCYCV